MIDITVTVSDEEFKALEWDIYDVQAHIQNAINVKAARTMDTLVRQNTNLNPGKLTNVEKENIVRDLNIETAKEASDRVL